jgi:hypothetical protein
MAMGVLFIWLAFREHAAFLVGTAVAFGFAMLFEGILRRVENTALRLSRTRIHVVDGEIRHVDEGGRVIASIRTEAAKIDMSSHAGGHTVFRVSGDGCCNASAEIVFTTHIEGAGWLVREVLKSDLWPVDDGSD